jgi:hypothetical protein
LPEFFGALPGGIPGRLVHSTPRSTTTLTNVVSVCVLVVAQLLPPIADCAALVVRSATFAGISLALPTAFGFSF